MLRVLIIICLVLLAGLQYRLWAVKENSLPHIARLNAEIAKQALENQRLQDRNKVLAAEVKLLKSGLDAVEARARQDLGMIKDDETFFMVVEKP